MRITRTLTTAIAVAALVAPAAQARPADDPPDMHASVALAAAQAREQQERASRPPGHAGDADWAPAVPTLSEDAASAPAPVQVAAADDGGVHWNEIGRGVLAVVLAAGGLALLANYRTQQHLRAGA